MGLGIASWQKSAIESFQVVATVIETDMVVCESGFGTMSFGVVIFLDDHSVDDVPSNWLLDDVCLWPPYRASRLETAMLLTAHLCLVLRFRLHVRLLKKFIRLVRQGLERRQAPEKIRVRFWQTHQSRLHLPPKSCLVWQRKQGAKVKETKKLAESWSWTTRKVQPKNKRLHAQEMTLTVTVHVQCVVNCFLTADLARCGLNVLLNPVTAGHTNYVQTIPGFSSALFVKTMTRPGRWTFPQ